MTNTTALVLGTSDKVSQILGLRIQTSAWKALLNPRCAASAADHWPTMTAVAGGAAVAEVSLAPDSHPSGLKGVTARLALRGSEEASDACLDSILSAVKAHVTRAHAIASLITEPAADGRLAPALERAGFQRATGSAIYGLDIVSHFWRSRDVLIIAEAGSNWRMGSRARDISMAKALIDTAAEAGADVVKFQTFQPDQLYVANAGTSDYLSDAGINDSMEALFADIQMPHDMLPILAAHARSVGIGFMSTAFSPTDFAAVDALVDVHKIASYEVTHARLIELAARSGKPTVMSTGAATLDDVAWAVDHYHRNGGRELCLMQCTAKYPAPLEALNLASIPEMARAFGVPVGLSDHSREAVTGPLAAAALGACAIEKHFTLHNRLPGPDHSFAITGEELKVMVNAVRHGAVARGTGLKALHSAETELALFAQRGLQAIKPIEPGEVLEEDGNFAIMRPGKQTKGMHPRRLPDIEGRIATRRIALGEGLREGDWSEAERG